VLALVAIGHDGESQIGPFLELRVAFVPASRTCTYVVGMRNFAEVRLPTNMSDPAAREVAAPCTGKSPNACPSTLQLVKSSNTMSPGLGSTRGGRLNAWDSAGAAISLARDGESITASWISVLWRMPARA